MPSNPEDTRRWLLDLQHHIVLAQGFLAGRGYEVFSEDTMCFYAVTRCLEIISEASRRLPAEIKIRHPSIEWQQMAASGNIYRHEYEDVGPRQVWLTATNKLPPLLAVVQFELAQL